MAGLGRVASCRDDPQVEQPNPRSSSPIRQSLRTSRSRHTPQRGRTHPRALGLLVGGGVRTTARQTHIDRPEAWVYRPVSVSRRCGTGPVGVLKCTLSTQRVDIGLSHGEAMGSAGG
jgi:hypothetical protein